MPRVRGHHMRTAGHLDQAQGTRDRGHQDESNQRERHPPGRPSRPGGALPRVDGHLAPAGSSGEPAELGTGRAAAVRCSRHSEYPSPTMAMPIGDGEQPLD